jgi:thioredoxin 2
MLRTCPACGAHNRIPPAKLASVGTCGKCGAALPASAAPIDVGDVGDVATFYAIVAGSPVPVVVDFWATWCGPCRMTAPEVKPAAADLAGRAVVVKIDTDKVPALAQRYQVSGIPNFAVFRGGKLAHQQAGALKAPQIVSLATTSTRGVSQ